ncbi:PaaI family thioesterase [Cupriavidus neocaledonicus]|uniref:Phenylacetic acid degradation protein n=1 Tax=Cupriavidus neocaledonicus TaxID=1040979 RepID=A0A375HMQ0_9BURK|nr:PaaI family thioesterase [Cupriavidus neocaledonicus]SOZ39177.1 Phenylacetic acid degradation-related protein [Cupriavidus neocaledonicus]SPD59152.1 Phenylacetic acid degradation protein [Cupriavidus neocaledonicus]
MTPDNYFTRMRRGEVPPPAICGLLGGEVRTVDTEAGTLEAAYVAKDTFLNPAGQVQGGMLGAMLDDVTAMLVTSTLANGEACSTLNLNLSFLRPGRPGPLQGRARLERRGRNVCNVVGQLWQDGQLLATATATCMVVRRA